METLFIFDRLRGRAFFIPRVCLHFIAATLVSTIVGFLPEAAVGHLYHGTALQPFTPFIAFIAALFGTWIARRLQDAAAFWVWLPGVLIFLFGLHDLSSNWSPSWSHAASRWQYAFSNLLTPDCGGTECLGELLYTTPLVCSIMYSIAALWALHKSRPEKQATRQGVA